MHIIILAAGMGTRLNQNKPKCLTVLSNGETILQRQINALLDYVDKEDITIVVGYKKNIIESIDAWPNGVFLMSKTLDNLVETSNK